MSSDDRGQFPDYFHASGLLRDDYNKVIERLSSRISYSERYHDEQYEYRHVRLPKDYTHLIPKDRLMSEAECRMLGIQQSPGWDHYMIHRPEPWVLLFRRPMRQ